MRSWTQIRVCVFICLIVIAALWVYLSCSDTSSSAVPAMADSEKISEAQPKYTKLALLVGINDYKYVKSLKGCINDVKNMRKLLAERYGFPDDDEHIQVLTDKFATRKAILEAIKNHLIAKASPDSIVVFHYSGHGSRAKDSDGDETDGYDETIVPYDSGRKAYPNRDITDDEINALLRRLTNKTVNVTFIFDSCHSGTAIRGAGLARTVEPDDRPPTEQESIPGPTARGVNEGLNDLRPADAQYALISGCTANEQSYETQVDGQSHGALTWNLTDQIRKAGPDATYRDIMDLVKTQVSATYPVQHPQLEGPGEDQLVFGDKSVAPTPYVLTNPGPGGTARLEAGHVHGVTRGSVYDIYAPGTKSFGKEVKPLAQAEITDVDITSAMSKITAGKLTVDAARAVESLHYWADPVIRIYFKELEKSEILQKIKDDLRAFKHIIPIDTESGYDLLLREHKEPKNGKNYIVTEGGDPTEISPRVDITDPDAVSHVVLQITHWAKWFNVLRIANQESELGVEFEIESERAARGEPGPAERQVSLSMFEGERFTISITNKSNRDLYLALLDLSGDGSVDVVYSARGAQEFVAPGKTLTKVLETYLPGGRDSICDILKVIATTQYADFSSLKQTAVRGGPRLTVTRGEAPNHLEELLANAAIGTTRGVKIIEVGNWTTLDRVLEVHRRK
jgi:hypothetical protein